MEYLSGTLFGKHTSWLYNYKKRYLFSIQNSIWPQDTILISCIEDASFELDQHVKLNFHSVLMHIYRLAASPGYIQHQTSIFNVHPRAQINIQYTCIFGLYI